jgi:hypothetical protein
MATSLDPRETGSELLEAYMFAGFTLNHTPGQ